MKEQTKHNSEENPGLDRGQHWGEGLVGTESGLKSHGGPSTFLQPHQGELQRSGHLWIGQQSTAEAGDDPPHGSQASLKHLECLELPENAILNILDFYSRLPSAEHAVTGTASY